MYVLYNKIRSVSNQINRRDNNRGKNVQAIEELFVFFISFQDNFSI